MAKMSLKEQYSGVLSSDDSKFARASHAVLDGMFLAPDSIVSKLAMFGPGAVAMVDVHLRDPEPVSTRATVLAECVKGLWRFEGSEKRRLDSRLTQREVVGGSLLRTYAKSRELTAAELRQMSVFSAVFDVYVAGLASAGRGAALEHAVELSRMANPQVWYPDEKEAGALSTAREVSRYLELRVANAPQPAEAALAHVGQVTLPLAGVALAGVQYE